MASEERDRPSVAFGHLAADRLSAERAGRLKRQLEEQQERLEGRRDSILERHPGAAPPDTESKQQRRSLDPGGCLESGCLEIVFEFPFRLAIRLLEFLLRLVGGLLEGLADLSI